MTNNLPHDPYIEAIVNALTKADLEPDSSWTSDAELDPYATGDDAGCITMLNAVISWDGTHTAVGEDGPEHGLFLFWDHPAEEWQYAEARDGGGNEEPEFLPNLGRYSHPDRVVATVRALLAGETPPSEPGSDWDEADAVRSAATAWEES